MNKTKRILASVMAVMLVLSVGYFSMMSQTSAWFYDSGVIDSGDRFFFAELSVDTAFVLESDITFNAATKLADENETLFDEAIHIDTVKLTNSGNISAKVTAEIKPETEAKGLRWFVYTEDMLVNGSVKETIKTTLSSLDKNTLEAYNNSQFFILAANETKTVKVASGVEYDDVSEQLSAGKTLDNYSAKITFTASHYTEG